MLRYNLLRKQIHAQRIFLGLLMKKKSVFKKEKKETVRTSKQIGLSFPLHVWPKIEKYFSEKNTTIQDFIYAEINKIITQESIENES
jgi:hypothetical protein